jgi:hypothetical protein
MGISLWAAEVNIANTLTGEPKATQKVIQQALTLNLFYHQRS